jgi:hypothetical protein
MGFKWVLNVETRHALSLRRTYLVNVAIFYKLLIVNILRSNNYL